jgi:hypothetical protein
MTTSNLKRFAFVFTRAQFESEDGINIVGGKALAIMSDKLAENSRGDVLLNTNIGMAEEAADVEGILSLPRMNKAELDASGLVDVYNSAAVTIAVRGEIAAKVRRAHADGARSISLDIVGLTLAGNRVDQATGDVREGAYLFNTRPGGIRIFAVDFSNVTETKAAGTNTGASAQRAVAPAPKRDWTAIKAKVAAMNVTAKQPEPTAPPAAAKISTLAVRAKLQALGLDIAVAPGIADVATPEDWAELAKITDAAEFKAALGFIGVTLA